MCTLKNHRVYVTRKTKQYLMTKKAKSSSILLVYFVVMCAPLILIFATAVYITASEMLVAYGYSSLPFTSLLVKTIVWAVIVLQLVLVIVFAPSAYKDSIFCAKSSRNNKEIEIHLSSCPRCGCAVMVHPFSSSPIPPESAVISNENPINEQVDIKESVDKPIAN